MTTKFQPGQRVRYIDESSTLTNGEVYTVSARSHDEGIRLEGFIGPGQWWYDFRFELAEHEPILVRTKEQVRDDRVKELLDGVVAYHTQGKEIPRDWIEELYYQR